MLQTTDSRGAQVDECVAEIYQPYQKLIQEQRKQGKSTNELLDDQVLVMREAVHCARDQAHVHLFLGLVLAQKGLLDEAVAAHREAVRLEPGTAHYRVHLGSTLDEMGRYDEAAAVLKEGVRIDPDDALLHNNLGDVLAKMGQFDEGIAEFREATRLAPQLGVSWAGLGHCQYRAGDYQGAIKSLTRSSELHHDNANDFAEDFLFLAMAEWQIGKHNDAHIALTKAIELMNKISPTEPDLSRCRAEAEELLHTGANKAPKTTSSDQK